MSVEYLTVPALGLAMWAGWALIHAWNVGWLARIATVVVILTYAGFSLAIGQATVRNFVDNSLRIKAFVADVVSNAREHPGKTVFLRGVDKNLFHDVVQMRAFSLFGPVNVYVIPEDDAAGSEYFALPAMLQKSLHQDRGIILDVSEGRARVVTAEVARSLKADVISSRVNLGDGLFDDQLGEGWYTNDGGFRWMGKRAMVTLAGPQAAGERLYVRGFGPEVVLKSGPVALRFEVDGVLIGTAHVTKPESEFNFDFELPARFAGARKIVLTVEVDRTLTLPNEDRVFGMVFTSFEVR